MNGHIQTTTKNRKPHRRNPEGLRRVLRELKEEMGRLDPSLLYSPSVDNLLGKPSLYDNRAALGDGEELLSVKLVPSEQVGAMPALHARWQHSDVIQDLSSREAEALAKAGFTVEDYQDGLGPFCYWREREISHAWVILSQGGWQISRSRSIKSANWESLTVSSEAVVPPLPGCPHNHRTVLRDGLIAVTVMLRRMLPWKITTMEEFSETMLALWEDAVEHYEKNSKQPQSVAV